MEKTPELVKITPEAFMMPTNLILAQRAIINSMDGMYDASDDDYDNPDDAPNVFRGRE